MIDRAAILSTGDELTTGKVVDTNSAYIADRLSGLGIKVTAVIKIGDNRQQFLWAMRQAEQLGELVIGTGGLGPTADDLTYELLAEHIDQPLIEDHEVVIAIKKRFRDRGLPWTDNNLKQALLPKGALVVPNTNGTAPGCQLTLINGTQLFWLPGVPREMTAMLEATVMPWIEAANGDKGRVHTTTFKVHGLTESQLDDRVKHVVAETGVTLSFRTHYPDLTLRVTLPGGPEKADAFSSASRRVTAALGSHVYAERDVTLEEVVGNLLSAKGETLSLAESCTGGLISHRITRIAGSSAYYYGGVVSYSNEAKMAFLGVKSATLEQFGAVSRETALEMSRGVRERTGANYGLGVTGIAGPAGGSVEKPVGTVWISLCRADRHEARLFRFHGERERIIHGTAQAALNWLRQWLCE